MNIKKGEGITREAIDAFKQHVAIQIFATLGTCSKGLAPHNSPKIILTFKRPFLYLIEHHKGYSFRNIKENPRVSISTFNLSRMTGFHLYGKAKIIGKGAIFSRLIRKFQKRKIELCTHEVIEAVKGRPGLQLRNFICLDPVLIYKIQLTKVTAIQAFSGKG